MLEKGGGGGGPEDAALAQTPGPAALRAGSHGPEPASLPGWLSRPRPGVIELSWKVEARECRRWRRRRRRRRRAAATACLFLPPAGSSRAPPAPPVTSRPSSARRRRRASFHLITSPLSGGARGGGSPILYLFLGSGGEEGAPRLVAAAAGSQWERRTAGEGAGRRERAPGGPGRREVGGRAGARVRGGGDPCQFSEVGLLFWGRPSRIAPSPGPVPSPPRVAEPEGPGIAPGASRRSIEGSRICSKDRKGASENVTDMTIIVMRTIGRLLGGQTSPRPRQLFKSGAGATKANQASTQGTRL